MASQWQPGSVWDNIDAAVKAVGLEHPGVIWGIANVDWPTTNDRDDFLRAISSKPAAFTPDDMGSHPPGTADSWDRKASTYDPKDYIYSDPGIRSDTGPTGDMMNQAQEQSVWSKMYGNDYVHGQPFPSGTI